MPSATLNPWGSYPAPGPAERPRRRAPPGTSSAAPIRPAAALPGGAGPGVQHQPDAAADALKALERDGLVELDESGSASVVDISPDDARDLLRIRETIDGVAARRAASLPAERRQALAAVLEPILEELDASSEVEDRYRFRVADSRFHVAILRHCESKQLTNCKAFVHGTALSIYASRIPSPGHLSQAAADHQQIARAIAAGMLTAASGRLRTTCARPTSITTETGARAAMSERRAGAAGRSPCGAGS